MHTRVRNRREEQNSRAVPRVVGVEDNLEVERASGQKRRIRLRANVAVPRVKVVLERLGNDVRQRILKNLAVILEKTTRCAQCHSCCRT
jgi:hypothetical protein